MKIEIEKETTSGAGGAGRRTHRALSGDRARGRSGVRHVAALAIGRKFDGASPHRRSRAACSRSGVPKRPIFTSVFPREMLIVSCTVSPKSSDVSLLALRVRVNRACFCRCMPSLFEIALSVTAGDLQPIKHLVFFPLHVHPCTSTLPFSGALVA